MLTHRMPISPSIPFRLNPLTSTYGPMIPDLQNSSVSAFSNCGSGTPSYGLKSARHWQTLSSKSKLPTKCLLGWYLTLALTCMLIRTSSQSHIVLRVIRNTLPMMSHFAMGRSLRIASPNDMTEPRDEPEALIGPRFKS